LLNGSHHTTLFWQQRVRMPEVGPVLAEDVGHFQR
jgi:hypothetical protein